MVLDEWASRWGIPTVAIADLRRSVLALDGTPATEGSAGLSEAAVQQRVRLEASRKGARLWRNNVGAGYSEDGSFMRWGLANDSKQLNVVLKSGDLIGIRPRLIQPGDVGHVIGQFLSREVKRPGWKFSGNPRETAQMNWASLITSLGGDASFCTGEGSL